MTNDQSDQVADVIAIRTLVDLYAYHLLHGEGPEIVDLYAEDGCFIVYKGGSEPIVNVKGHDGLKDVHKDRSGSAVVPLITNLLVKVTGKTATGTCLMFSPRSGRQDAPGPPFYGEYCDQYVCIDGRWRFQERKFTYSS